MRFTRESHSSTALRVAVLGGLVAVALALWIIAGPIAVASGGPLDVGQSGGLSAQTGDDPEANLPFLFAVYIVTWAVFFAYVFYVSRRQREMQGEIEALKRALDERDREAAEQEPETESGT